LASWGHAALRFVRADRLVRRIRPRRAICLNAAGCGRSHVLLPRFCLGRRVDVVAVIWAALLARAAGQGWPVITAAAGCPASTVRGWLSRFEAHAEAIRVAFAWVERLVAAGGDLDRLTPTGGAVADAVAQIGAACAAVRRRWGSAVLAVPAAQMVAACSGGWLLGGPGVAARRGVGCGRSGRTASCPRTLRRIFETRSDGARIGIRGSSKSGGRTIDISRDGQTLCKIHIK